VSRLDHGVGTTLACDIRLARPGFKQTRRATLVVDVEGAVGVVLQSVRDAEAMAAARRQSAVSRSPRRRLARQEYSQRAAEIVFEIVRVLEAYRQSKESIVKAK